MLTTMFEQLGLKEKIARTIEEYRKIFSDEKEQPNVIADSVSLILNNFVSTIGREYIKNLNEAKEKADMCSIGVDLNDSDVEIKRKSHDLIETLNVFEKSSKDFMSLSQDELTKLPFVDNFNRWLNFVTIGLIYTSDISRKKPEENNAVKNLMDQLEQLYK